MNVQVTVGNSYLGRGAFGRVFRVTKDDAIFALKIVEKSSARRLEREVTALKSAEHTGLAVSCIEEVKCFKYGAAILLSPVGKSLSLPLKTSEVKILFNLLWKLHQEGLVHGDPRVPNVIIVEEKYLWIDLFEIMKASPSQRSWDAELLTRSILKIDKLDEELTKLVEEYGENAIKENLEKLIEMVCTRLETLDC